MERQGRIPHHDGSREAATSDTNVNYAVDLDEEDMPSGDALDELDHPLAQLTNNTMRL